MPRAPRPTPYLITSLAQIRALRSPVRQEIIDAVSAAGPCTIARLAGLLDRRPDGLYFHIRALERVGLLVAQGMSRAGRHAAAVYDLPGHPVQLHYEPTDPANLRAIAGVVGGVLRLTKRDFARSLGKPWAVTEGPRRNTWGGRARGWLTPMQAARINRHIAAIIDLVRSARPRPGARPHAVTFVLTPLALPAPKTTTPARKDT